jgi:2'-5' RNA ligase
MAAPYLIEVRTGGQLKSDLREIIYDVAEKFNVSGAAEPRAVPHLTLYGPYNTDKGRQVKRTLTNIYEQYDIVPYIVDGFDHFQEDVIYAKVVPSPELRSLRREIRSQLKPLTYNERSHDSNYYYNFHITIAFKDIGGKFDDILIYVNNHYSPSYEEYALRFTSLRRGDMMWEYDLLQDAVLEPDEATSARSWQRTEELLEEQSSSGDHEELVKKPWPGKRVFEKYHARMTGKW